MEILLTMDNSWVLLLFLSAQTITAGRAQMCMAPNLAKGTRHNGTADAYNISEVLFYSCDVGFLLNSTVATSRCRWNSSTEASWDVPNIQCHLDAKSLVIALGAAIAGIILFIVLFLLIIKRPYCRRPQNNSPPKVVMRRRNPRFIEEQPTYAHAEGRSSLYDSIVLDDERSISDQYLLKTALKQRHSDGVIANNAAQEAGKKEVDGRARSISGGDSTADGQTSNDITVSENQTHLQNGIHE